MKVQYHVSSSDLTDVEDVGGWVKIFTDSELDSDEWRGTTSGLRRWYERLRCRVMAAYVATPSHEKTYPFGCASGYFTQSVRILSLLIIASYIYVSVTEWNTDVAVHRN